MQIAAECVSVELNPELSAPEVWTVCWVGFSITSGSVAVLCWLSFVGEFILDTADYISFSSLFF